jgi:predicted RNase H-like HicB family nuclease
LSKLVVTEEEGKWSAHDPKVPGAYGLGDTKEEALADLREMLELLADHEARERKKKLIGERKLSE